MVDFARVQKELQECNKDNDVSGISIKPKGDNLTHLAGTIPGPLATPYEGGTFNIDIILPDGYPFEPPRMQFATKVCKMNWAAVADKSLSMADKPPLMAGRPSLLAGRPLMQNSAVCSLSRAKLFWKRTKVLVFYCATKVFWKQTVAFRVKTEHVHEHSSHTKPI
ncbi:unnamed protein product [Camellia sinensis]